MKNIKNIFLTLAVLIFSAQHVLSQNIWVNDLRSLFLRNSAIIYEINIRTFGAVDKNKDGIIDFSQGEESGNFLNAMPKLEDLAQKGINTIHILPITPVGKTKALGTAGSLYAISSFDTLNPQLKSKNSSLSLNAQAVKFINEAHRHNIRVIFDLPSCGAYDLYMQHPELFVKDKSGKVVIPADWTDVRLFDAGSETGLNSDVYNLYKSFVDMALDLGADGIRADVAPLKPAKFWKDLIQYSRLKDPQFLWIAEAYDNQVKISDYAALTLYNQLLNAGFDGYYGNFAALKDFKSGKQLIDLIVDTKLEISKYSEPKSVITSIVTHDEMSPILVHGAKFSEMIIWLNATLPFNSYFTDGFDTGDNYLYMWANKKAPKTYTDDDIYFVHRGKLDIFNFSRQPGGNNSTLLNNFVLANRFKIQNLDIIKNGNFVPLKTSNPSTFAYSVSNNNACIIVIGNLDFRTELDTVVKVPKLSKNQNIIPVKIDSVPLLRNGAFDVKLQSGEVIVLLLDKFEVK